MEEIQNFNDTKLAFGNKTTRELKRARFLFTVLGQNWLMALAKPVLSMALKLGLPLGPLIKPTIFAHFCGGESLMECKNSIDTLYQGTGIRSILDYSVESAKEEDSFDAALQTLLEVCAFAQDRENVPFLVFKPSALGSLQLFQMVSEEQPLAPGEAEQWDRTVQRFRTLCGAVADTGHLKVMVDAEESWGHPAVDWLVEEMMVLFNTERTVVFTTVQLYLEHKLDYLQRLEELAKGHGITVGVKLVRGAYMEKEARRALEMGYPNPVCGDKARTDHNFEQGADLVLDKREHFELFLGTHNERSCLGLVRKIQKLGIAPKDGRIWFGQLYGMGDNIGHILSQHGYNVAKYVPFGPLKEVMPYLMRRMEENSSVGAQSSRELELIRRELLRRKQG